MKKQPTKPQSWTEKIISPREVGQEPPLNREGFWKPFEPTEFEVEVEKK